MAPHSLGSGTISFGLVSIPVKLYTAASSGGVSFNLLHAKCGSRIKQQILCPVCNEVVERSSIVKGYEFSKDQYVRFTEDELSPSRRGLEGHRHRRVVPLSSVDRSSSSRDYLGTATGGEKPLRLLADAMAKATRWSGHLRHAWQGSLVSSGPRRRALMLHTMYFADEVRDSARSRRASR